MKQKRLRLSDPVLLALVLLVSALWLLACLLLVRRHPFLVIGLSVIGALLPALIVRHFRER